MLPLSLGAVAVYARVLDAAYPIEDWLFWPIVQLWLWGALFSLACVSLGHLVLSKLLRQTELPTLETMVTSFAIGVVGFTLAMTFAGAVGWFRTWSAIGLPLALTASGAAPLLRFWRLRTREWRPASVPRSSRAGTVALLVGGGGVTCVVFVYLGMLTPTAINFDAYWYHLPAAQDYARAGKFIPFYSDYMRALPQLATLAYTWGWLLPGLDPTLRAMMAQHLEFTFFLWTLAGVAAAVRWLLDGESLRSTWAAFFLFPAIFVYDQNLGAAADHVLACFAAPVFLAAVRALPALDGRAGAKLGILLGGALLTKYHAVYLFAAAGVVVGGGWVRSAWRLRRRSDDERRHAHWQLLTGPAVLIATVLLLTAPHFLKNYVFYRNPVYPLALSLFPASYPQHPQSLLFLQTIHSEMTFVPTGTLLERLRFALRLALTCSFEPHYSFTNHVPVLGSLFVLLAPFALFVRRPARIWLGLAAGYTGTVVWAFSYFVDRYLQILVPLLAAVTAAIIVKTWRTGWIGRVAILPPVLLQLVWSGDAVFYSSAPRLHASISLLTSGFAKHVEQRFPETHFVQAGRSLPPDARVLFHGERRSLGIDRDLVFDGANQQWLVYYDDLRGPRALFDYYSALGISHLAWATRTDVMTSKQAEVLFTELVTNHSPRPSRFGDLFVTSMPAVRPPPDSEYLVVTLGTAFANGLYRVDQLAVHELLPNKVFPRPLEPIVNPEQASAAIPRARAVVVGDGHALHALERRALAEFIAGVRYRNHVVYVRRHSARP